MTRSPTPETPVTAAVVVVGSELTSGARLDTNSRWLSRELADLGITVVRHATVADDLDQMAHVIGDAATTTDLVLVTGGLGPTRDDVTRDALAQLAGVDLVLDAASLEHVRAMFERRGRTMPERNAVQAMFPRGSEPIPNPRGTAPGVLLRLPRRDREEPALVVALPGVPSEMKRMFRREVQPRLPLSGHVIRHRCLKCFGVGESHCEELLGELTARGREPEVGITVHEATITLRITARGASDAECEAALEGTAEEIRRRLGKLVFAESEDEELWHTVVRAASERGVTLATAESGTGGLLAHVLTDAVGFERCYLGGVVAPTAAARKRLLDVALETDSEFDAVRRDVAEAMAAGCRRHFESDYALAVTECPTWDADDANAAIPEAFVALATPDRIFTDSLRPAGDPAIRKMRTVKTALNLLRRHLSD